MRGSVITASWVACFAFLLLIQPGGLLAPNGRLVEDRMTDGGNGVPPFPGGRTRVQAVLAWADAGFHGPVPGGKVIAPAAPTNVAATLGTRTDSAVVVLTWTPPAGEAATHTRLIPASDTITIAFPGDYNDALPGTYHQRPVASPPRSADTFRLAYPALAQRVKAVVRAGDSTSTFGPFGISAPLVLGVGCKTSTTGWGSAALSPQTGSFTVQFDAIPNGTAVDAVTGFSATSTALYSDLAVIARFNASGMIDARNGAAYAATSVIPYVAGTTYHFRLVVNVPAHTYSAFVAPAGGMEQTIGINFAFRSEQSAVAALGSWTWHAESGSATTCNVSVPYTVPVNPIAKVTVLPTTMSLYVGQTVLPTVLLQDVNGATVLGGVTWTTSSPSVATVDAGSGRVLGMAPGTATITATSTNALFGSTVVRVTLVPVRRMEVTPALDTMVVGTSVQLVATTYDSAGNTLFGRPITWSTATPSIVSVSPLGMVGALNGGAGQVTATSDALTATATIVVRLPAGPGPTLANRLYLVPASLSPTQGGAQTFYAILRDSTGAVTTGVDATWTSSDSTIAVVTGFGLAHFRAPGLATITATAGSLSGTAAVNVMGVTVTPVLLSVGAFRVTNVPSRWFTRLPAMLPLYTGSYLVDLLGVTDTAVVGRAFCTVGTP